MNKKSDELDNNSLHEIYVSKIELLEDKLRRRRYGFWAGIFFAIFMINFGLLCLEAADRSVKDENFEEEDRPIAVSYTHLTLPTKA